MSPILGLVELSSSSELFSSTSFLDIWIFCFCSELDGEVKIDFLSSEVMAEFVLKIFCILIVCYTILSKSCIKSVKKFYKKTLENSINILNSFYQHFKFFLSQQFSCKSNIVCPYVSPSICK